MSLSVVLLAFSFILGASQAQQCCDGEIRLAGGNSTSGRVEICFNNEWGTVCDDGWDVEDARVVCRQLGLPTTSPVAKSFAYFGAGQGSIFLDNVGCIGNEQQLQQCSHIGVGTHNCAHSEDAGVICDVCVDGDVRLVGGDESSGRVEICFGNTWGTVCDDYWSTQDARVVCRQLGLPSYSPLAVGSARFGQGQGPIFLDDLSCTGNELQLQYCPHLGTGNHNCAHYEDAGVICSACHNGDVRLAGGSELSGRVEICLDGVWGTVCDDGWDDNDARVVCRQLGLPLLSPTATHYGSFGTGQGLIHLDTVSCDGTEQQLQLCSHDGVGNHDCSHYEDAGVTCSYECENGDVRLVGGSATSGRVEICLNNVWGTVCDDGWGTEDARVVCRQLGLPTINPTAIGFAFFGLGEGPILLDDVGCDGDEQQLQYCSHIGVGNHNCGHYEDAGVICSYVCRDGEVRLVGGDATSGRVELCVNNTWGTVCDDYWDDEDARVVCRQLGLPTTAPTARSYAYFGAGYGAIHLDDLRCEGDEQQLLQCSHIGVGNHNCGHYEDAGVVCNVCEDGEIRLLGGDATSGRVEICSNNEWGTVCDDNWDIEDARVVCRQLGLPTTAPIALSNAAFGPGHGSIHLDGISCTGSELELQQCSHYGIGNHDCGHYEDSGVICSYVCRDGEVRLVGGDATSGRVEICFNNTWGTVCDDLWNDDDAKVVCSQLGLPSTTPTAVSNAAFGPGQGPIYIDNVLCTGSEQELQQCAHNGVGLHDCSHYEDAGVVCKGCCTGDVRLVGGGEQSGRVEICFNGEWGTVCDDGWDANDARVVCRQLGLPTSSAIPMSRASFGYGQGSIYLDDVSCAGDEEQLQYCTHIGVGSHNCGHYEDAGVICSDVCTNGEVRLVGGNAVSGRVEICFNNEWGTVCDDYWDVEDARVVCRQLGLPSTSPIALTSARFGYGTGQIYLDNVFCNGYEQELQQCSHNGISVHNCGHNEDAGVVCDV